MCVICRSETRHKRRPGRCAVPKGAARPLLSPPWPSGPSPPLPCCSLTHCCYFAHALPPIPNLALTLTSQHTPFITPTSSLPQLQSILPSHWLYLVVSLLSSLPPSLPKPRLRPCPNLTLTLPLPLPSPYPNPYLIH